MNKILKVCFFPLIALTLSSCAFFEFQEYEKLRVDLGNGEEYVRWNLVENDNILRPVDSAYFEFNKTCFRYYENGELKKEGNATVNYYGLEDPVSQLSMRFTAEGEVYSHAIIHTFTEDAKDDVHQFTFKKIGYEIKPVRRGGVPVRDYYLSDMPYAFGTYVKEGREQYTYTREKASSNYSGVYLDANGNRLYLINNSYKPDTSYYNNSIYLHYDHGDNKDPIEGLLKLSSNEKDAEQVNNGLLYVMHGDSEPASERGASEFADYWLRDFFFDEEENAITFTSVEYFDDQECEYDPANFIGGSYKRFIKL